MENLVFELLIFIGPVFLAYLAWNERDKRDMKHKLADTVTKKEAEHIHEVLSAPNRVRTQEIKEDIKRIETKLDKILENMSHSK